jgi:hypothetical protein
VRFLVEGQSTGVEPFRKLQGVSWLRGNRLARFFGGRALPEGRSERGLAYCIFSLSTTAASNSTRCLSTRRMSSSVSPPSCPPSL